MILSMKKVIHATAICWLFMPVIAHAQWVLVYSAEDEFCQHMLKQMSGPGQGSALDPSKFPEVQSLEWVLENQILDHQTGQRLMDTTAADNRAAIADVNNDGVDDIAYILESIPFGERVMGDRLFLTTISLLKTKYSKLELRRQHCSLTT